MAKTNQKLFERLSPKALLAIALIVAVAGVVAITLAVLAREGDDGPGLDPAVEQLIPDEGSEVLVQTNVGLDLVDSPSYTIISFRINGNEVIEDGILFSAGTNRLTYQIGEGQIVEELRPEQNCITAEFYPTLEGEASTRRVNWCFNAS